MLRIEDFVDNIQSSKPLITQSESQVQNNDSLQTNLDPQKFQNPVYRLNSINHSHTITDWKYSHIFTTEEISSRVTKSIHNNSAQSNVQLINQQCPIPYPFPQVQVAPETKLKTIFSVNEEQKTSENCSAEFGQKLSSTCAYSKQYHNYFRAANDHNPVNLSTINEETKCKTTKARDRSEISTYQTGRMEPDNHEAYMIYHSEQLYDLVRHLDDYVACQIF